MVEGPAGALCLPLSPLRPEAGAPAVTMRAVTGDFRPTVDPHDEANLLVAFTCHEPDRKKPLIIGGPPWDDDEIEGWVDADGDGQTFRQVIVNGANIKAEYWESGPNPIGATTAVCAPGGNFWAVELAIPYEGLGVKPPRPGEQWRLSLCRGRAPGRNNPTYGAIGLGAAAKWLQGPGPLRHDHVPIAAAHHRAGRNSAPRQRKGNSTGRHGQVPGQAPSERRTACSLHSDGSRGSCDWRQPARWRPFAWSSA